MSINPISFLVTSIISFNGLLLIWLLFFFPLTWLLLRENNFRVTINNYATKFQSFQSVNEKAKHIKRLEIHQRPNETWIRILELEGPMILSCPCNLSMERLNLEKLSVLMDTREMTKKHFLYKILSRLLNWDLRNLSFNCSSI